MYLLQVWRTLLNIDYLVSYENLQNSETTLEILQRPDSQSNMTQEYGKTQLSKVLSRMEFPGGLSTLSQRSLAPSNDRGTSVTTL